MAVIQEGDFKGNKMIVLLTSPDSEYPFQFGRKKAELICACWKEIKHFADTGEILVGNNSSKPAGVEPHMGTSDENGQQAKPNDDIPF